MSRPEPQSVERAAAVDLGSHGTVPETGLRELPETLIAAVERLSREAASEGLTLGDLMDRLGERAFGAALFALALPVCIPFLYVVPQIVSLPMLALAGQMAAGRERPWLPARFEAHRIDGASLARMGAFARRWFGWSERFARPRLTVLTGPTAERLVGGVFCFFCLSILTPLPSTNTVPGIAVALGSVGLMERDGLLVLAGLVLGTVWIGILILGAVFLGTVGVSAIVEAVRGLFG